HRRTVIGAIEQAGLDQRGIARDVARPQPGRIRALRQASEYGEPLEIAPAQRMRGSKRTERRARLVEINLRIAFVGRDDEAELIGALEQISPSGEVEHASRRVVG